MYFFTSFPRLDLSEAGVGGEGSILFPLRAEFIVSKKKEKNPAPPQIDTHLCPTLIPSYNHF